MPYWDYSGNGAYFITLCVNGRNCIFGHIENKKMILNGFGEIAHNEWEVSPTIRDEIELDAFVIMPNHLHGIVILKKPIVDAVFDLNDGSRNDTHDGSHVETHGRASLPENGRASLPENQPENHNHHHNHCQNPSPQKPQRKPKSISSFIAGFKSAVTTKINNLIDLRMQTYGPAFQFATTKFNQKNRLWQLNYYDHIIRNSVEFIRIKKYIISNPSNWQEDKFYK